MAKLDKKLAHELKLGDKYAHMHSHMKSHSPIMCHLIRIRSLVSLRIWW